MWQSCYLLCTKATPLFPSTASRIVAISSVSPEKDVIIIMYMYTFWNMPKKEIIVKYIDFISFSVAGRASGEIHEANWTEIIACSDKIHSLHADQNYHNQLLLYLQTLQYFTTT